MIVKITNTKTVETLFAGWEESTIWSCLQSVMGDIYGEDSAKPESAMAVLGDFCFFAGNPDKNLVLYKPTDRQRDFIIMVPQTDLWGDVIKESYGDRAKPVTRYAIKKEPGVFDVAHLQAIVASLPPEYTCRIIDEALYEACKANEWSKDLVAQFSNYELYEELGLGVVVLKDEELVSGASSYSRYHQGIEIEIDTKEPFRRQGLASVCGAKLILECLRLGLYPSWDAQNKWSVALAEKLGYQFDHEYIAYEIWDY